MAKTEVGRDERLTPWRNPVLRFEGSARAPAETVFDLLADLQAHLEWAGQRQHATKRLLTMESPTGQASVGVEFLTTGSDSKIARWSDRSVVTEASRSGVFEFVTEGRWERKPGSKPWLSTAVHRYEIATEAEGSHVTYTQHLTRLAGAPKILLTRVGSRIVFWMSARYMRRGFDALLALAEERSGLR